MPCHDSLVPLCYASPTSMGLAVMLITVCAERLNRTRIGRVITTGVATVVIAWAVCLALALTHMLVLAAFGYYD